MLSAFFFVTCNMGTFKPIALCLYLWADGRGTTSSKSGLSEPAKIDLALPSAELVCREYLPKKATACQLFH